MQGYVVYPGGQSGNPGSKFYNSMVDSWAKGEYYTTQFGGTPDAVKSKLFTSKFVPKK
jgi:penicillin amidase